MREYLLQFMGEEAAMGVQFMVALLAVLILFGVFVWFLRLITGKGRRKVVSKDHRLAILDRTQIDDTRSLVLVRRDDVEHLVMIGGPSDVVVESNIDEYADESDRHSEHPLPGHEIARRVIAQRPLRTMSLSGSAATVAESIGLAAASRPEVSLAPPPPEPESSLIHDEPSFKSAEAQPEVLIEPQSAEEAHPVVIPPQPLPPEVPAVPEAVTPAPAVAAAPVAAPAAAPAPLAPVAAALAPEVSMPVAAVPVPEAPPAPVQAQALAPAPAPEILAQPAPAPEPVQIPQPAPVVVTAPEPTPEPQLEAALQPTPQPAPVQPMPAPPVAAVPVSPPEAPAVDVAAPAPVPVPEPVQAQAAPVVEMAPPLAEQAVPVQQPAPQPAPVLTTAPQQAPPAAEPEPTPRDLTAEMENALMQELEQPPASLSRVNHVVRQEQPVISTPTAAAAPTPTVMPAASSSEQQGDTPQQDIDLSAGLAAAMGLEPEVPATPQYSEEQRAQDDLALEDAIAGMLIGDQPHNGTSDPAESSVYSASESVPEGPERPVDTTRPGRVDDEMSRLLQELAIPSRA